MMRASAIVLVVATFITGCAGQARKPAAGAGGVLAAGGIALTAFAMNRDCGSGRYGDGFTCVNEAVLGTVAGLVLAGVGTGLLVGALLGDEHERSPQDAASPPLPPLELTPVAAVPPPSEPSAPSAPAPAMEPEPASW